LTCALLLTHDISRKLAVAYSFLSFVSLLYILVLLALYFLLFSFLSYSVSSLHYSSLVSSMNMGHRTVYIYLFNVQILKCECLKRLESLTATKYCDLVDLYHGERISL
jgi:hypothetical protein